MLKKYEKSFGYIFVTNFLQEVQIFQVPFVFARENERLISQPFAPCN